MVIRLWIATSPSPVEISFVILQLPGVLTRVLVSSRVHLRLSVDFRSYFEAGLDIVMIGRQIIVHRFLMLSPTMPVVSHMRICYYPSFPMLERHELH